MNALAIKFLQIGISLILFALPILGVPQACLATTLKTEHFRVEYNKLFFTDADAGDVASAAETAWDFYKEAGFTMPASKPASRIVISFQNLTLLSSSASIPGYKLTRDHIYLVTHPGDSREFRRLVTAHELFHQVVFASGVKGDLNRWFSEFIGASNITPTDKAEFWMFFEGMNETMAWLVFPDLAGMKAFPPASISNEYYNEGRFWFSPEALPNGGDCSPFRLFSNPWNIQPVCGAARNLETQSYKTIPFWIGVAQWTSDRHDHLGYAKALRNVLNRIAYSSKTYSLINAIRHGIDSYLETFQLSRKDIRDLMSLSAGVERFHDDMAFQYRIAHFRDYEAAGNDVEDPDTFPSWVLSRAMIAAPTSGNILKFADIQIPALANVSTGQTFEARYNSVLSGLTNNTLPAFAGVLQGLAAANPSSYHPIAVHFVPPGAIEFRDHLASDPRIHPVAVTGLRRDGFDDLELDFPMKSIDIRNDAEGHKLALNNFRFRDLSVFRVIGYDSALKYRYSFLGKHGKSLRVSASPNAPGNSEPSRLLSLSDGEWVIRGVEPRPSQHVSVMLTPADLPTEAGSISPCNIRRTIDATLTPAGKPIGDGSLQAWSPFHAWCNNTFDIVERREDKMLGKWTTPVTAIKRSTHWTVVTTPAPASAEAKQTNTRLDIARFEPGNHGGGRYFITAVDADLENKPMPDLLVRGTYYLEYPFASVSASPANPFNPRVPDKGCMISQVINVYVANQGTQTATNVQVALQGSLEIISADGVTFKTRLKQTQPVQGKLNSGETKLIKFVVGDKMPFGSIGGVNVSLTLDPGNLVDEVMEANNIYAVPPIDFICNKPPEIQNRDNSSIDFGDIVDELPSNPQALIRLEQHLPSASDLFKETAQPLVDWIHGKGPMPASRNNPRYRILLERLEPMVEQGLFQPDALAWFSGLAPDERIYILGGTLNAVQLRKNINAWVYEKTHP